MTQVYYRVAVLIILISSLSCGNVTTQNSLESQLHRLLTKWQVGSLDTGKFTLPSLRSLKIPDVKHSFDRKGIKMAYILNKMVLTGLDNFLIKELKVVEATNSLEMSISLNIPKLTLYAEKYELKGRAYLMYPLKGSGDMTVIFRDSDLTFKISFLTTDGGISTRIGDFKLDFNVHLIEANLVDSSWPINKVLNTDGAEILSSYHDEISQAMSFHVVPYMDHNLVNVTIAQIVNTILGMNY